MDYIYRVVLTSWAVVVTLSAEFLPMEEVPGFTVVNPKLGLLNKCEKLTEKEVDLLFLGARLIGRAVEAALKEKPGVVLVIDTVEHPVLDYQEEGIAAAVAGLIARKFSLPEPNIRVEFDKSRNRYVFHFGEVV